MSSISADDFDCSSTAIWSANVDCLLNDYLSKGGSSKFSMVALGANFAHIVPFSNSYFLHHFSAVGRQAIEDETQNSRPIFPCVGPVPPNPCSVTAVPYVYPAQGNVPIGSMPGNFQLGPQASTQQNSMDAIGASNLPPLNLPACSNITERLPPSSSFNPTEYSSWLHKPQLNEAVTST